MAQSPRGGTGFAQVIVFLLILVVIMGLVVVGGRTSQTPIMAVKVTAEATAEATAAVTSTTEATSEATAAVQPRVYFSQPTDGATVSTTFTVNMVAEGLTVEPAGTVHADAGHFHILIDTPFIDAGQVIPKDATHLHFGEGQLTTQLTLTPGTHILRLQFANGAHVALDGDQYRDQITITVQ